MANFSSLTLYLNCNFLCIYRDLKRRYEPATESRNNFVASSQNLTNTHNYLSNIKFPYVTRPEVDTLNKAVSHIYTDLQTPERHSHANNCYTVTHKRAAALLQWFDNVSIKATALLLCKYKENYHCLCVKCSSSCTKFDNVSLNTDSRVSGLII